MNLHGLFAVAWLGPLAVVVACGGGAGPLVTTTGGDGRDDPGSTYDTPPATSDTAGGNCLQCDVTYVCPNAGSPFNQGISLDSSGGSCTQALINVVCSGALFGTGACSGGGGGAFTCGDITCTPEQQNGSSSGFNGSGSSSGATPGGSSGSSSGQTGFADAG